MPDNLRQSKYVFEKKPATFDAPTAFMLFCIISISREAQMFTEYYATLPFYVYRTKLITNVIDAGPDGAARSASNLKFETLLVRFLGLAHYFTKSQLLVKR